jgi:AraC family transcriptional regulator
MKADIVQHPEIRVAALRHRGAYNRISETFKRFAPIAHDAGLFVPGALPLALYYDNPMKTPEADLRSDAAISIPEGAKVPNGLVEQRIPAGRYARTTWVGPYETLPKAWATLTGEWLANSGQKPADGVSYERYCNDPSDTPPEKLVTEIYIPLA